MVSSIEFVQLDEQQDSIKWNLNNKRSFSVQSVYKNLVNQLGMPLNKDVWKLKLPIKVKVFIWFFLKGVILTKDNLIKRNWRGDENCCFCNTNETIQHIFLIAMCAGCLKFHLVYVHQLALLIFLVLGLSN